MGLHIRHSLCKCSPSITKDIKYNIMDEVLMNDRTQRVAVDCQLQCIFNVACRIVLS